MNKKFKKEELLRAISSNKIHFIIGAGFNNGITPLAANLNNTKSMIKQISDIKETEESNAMEENFEEWIQKIVELNYDKFEQIFKSFKEGIKLDLCIDSYENYSEIVEKLKEQDQISIKEIRDFIIELNKMNLIKNRGNGELFKNKKTYFWTLNYDNLLQKIFWSTKIPSFTIDPDYNDENILNLSLINDLTKTLLPIYFIYKVHGNKNNPIIPGHSKYNSFLIQNDIFQGYMNMKNLVNDKHGMNIIFIIGYSLSDQHINNIIIDSKNNSNIVIYMDYDKKINSTSFGDNLCEESHEMEGFDDHELFTIKTSNAFKSLMDLLKEVTIF